MAEELADRVAHLTARLELIEAERDILATLHRYGHSIDYGEEAAWVDCFTEDGVFDVRFVSAAQAQPRDWGFGTPHPQGARFSGRDELRRYVARHSRAPAAWHKHFMVQPQITLAPQGGEARVRSYFARLDAVDGQRVIHAFGRYQDEMVHCPDGAWRFRQRICEIESLRA